MTKIGIESKSQRARYRPSSKVRCILYDKDRNWKQITTQSRYGSIRVGLYSLWQRSELKANHNIQALRFQTHVVVFSMTKIGIESKSQLRFVKCLRSPCCILYDKDRNWKQITTLVKRLTQPGKLYSLWQRSELKANHNIISVCVFMAKVVFSMTKIGIESKSQLWCPFDTQESSCILYDKDRNWKQITTIASEIQGMCRLYSLWQRSELKANHNCGLVAPVPAWVVFSMTKIGIESKSQPLFLILIRKRSCILYDKDRNWKQITTGVSRPRGLPLLYSLWQRSELKANHNTTAIIGFSNSVVFSMTKIGIESKSQHWGQFPFCWIGCILYDKDRNWKQITTSLPGWKSDTLLYSLWQRSELKANHNVNNAQSSSI